MKYAMICWGLWTVYETIPPLVGTGLGRVVGNGLSREEAAAFLPVIMVDARLSKPDEDDDGQRVSG